MNIDDISELREIIYPGLMPKFKVLIEFLLENPEVSPNFRGKNIPKFGSEEYILKIAKKFLEDRKTRSPKVPKTIPDTLVFLFLTKYYNIPKECVETAMLSHAYAMGAENIIGWLLEYYMASVLEPKGWVWCSGSTLRSIDFIEPSRSILLQVKNRDNTENSSSNAVRNGTPIIKWFRTFSKNGNTNWDNFPDHYLYPELSEANFQKFVCNYLYKITN